jgi:hypothetical protein
MRQIATMIACGALFVSGCGAEENSSGGDDGTAQAEVSAQATEGPSVLDLSCTYPVNGNSDTAQTVLDRFGRDARRETLGGPEGTEWAGIVLWGDDPARRLELFLDDGPGERIFNVAVRSPESRWRVAGVKLGGSVADVTAVNGRPFTFWGFGWDYGGWITDFGGGGFDTLTGGCEAQIRLGPSSVSMLPDGTVGEVQVKSDDPRVSGIAPIVDEMGLAWR